MKSLNASRFQDSALPLVADDIVEFHAARLLLLVRLCGTAGKIDGLTKLAKLDFFVRYPQFFNRIDGAAEPVPRQPTIESSMVRFHYGPWDPRYYDILAFLSARQLIAVSENKKTVVIQLTAVGKRVAEGLVERPEYEEVIAHMKKVKSALGAKTGSALKNLIYRTFKSEVSRKRLGELITE